MATTYTWKYNNGSYTANGSYVIDSTSITVKATTSSVSVTLPARTIALSETGVTGKAQYYVQPHGLYYTYADGTSKISRFSDEFTSAKVNVGTKVSFPTGTLSLSTGNLFSSANPTEAYKDCQIKFPSASSLIATVLVYDGGIQRPAGPASQLTVGTARIELDVPPTATVSTLSVDTAYIYAGLTTASVTVADTTAYYGGTVSSATLTIGNQTASISGDGTLSILLNAGGTFTPIVTITDSRGQTKDYTLDPITVSIYSTPTVNFDAQRTDVNGKIADEGAYATIVTTLTFDPIAEAEAPSVSITDEDGNVVADEDISITWYSSRASDGTLSGAVTWSTLASGSTVYGLISITGDFDTQKSYVISLTPQDSEGITGGVKTDTLQTAFYTVDFLAGGHGIAFGKPAVNVGFECGMDATFDETLTAQDMTAQEVQDFVDGVGGGTGAFADKVIEQGTSGIWTYRKWASGIAECWGAISWAVTSWSTWGNLYYSTYSGTVNYPNGLFISAPILTSQSNAPTNDNWLGSRAGPNYGNTKDHTNDFFLVRPTTGSTSMTAYAYAHAIGRWK